MFKTIIVGLALLTPVFVAESNNHPKTKSAPVKNELGDFVANIGFTTTSLGTINEGHGWSAYLNDATDKKDPSVDIHDPKKALSCGGSIISNTSGQTIGFNVVCVDKLTMEGK